MARNLGNRPGGAGMKTTVTLYIYQRPGQQQYPLTVDMSAYPQSYGVLLGTREIEIDFEPFDSTDKAAQIDALQLALTRERANFTDVEGRYLARIAALRNAQHDD